MLRAAGSAEARTSDPAGAVAPGAGMTAVATPSPTISVIMPAYNAAHYLERSLPPLIAMRDRGEVLEVLVMDDCSSDPRSPQTAQRLGAELSIMERNGGPGAARNQAARVAKGDILWFVDADVVVSDGSPQRICNALAEPTVWAVFGSYDRDPPARNFASQYKNLVHRYYHQRGHGEASTFWAGCGAVRREAFLAVGGFDRMAYGRPSIEDIELGRRLRDGGGRIRLVADLECTHLKHWTLPELIRTDIFQRALPWSRLLLASPRKVDELNVSGAEKVRAVLAALWVMSLFGVLGSGFSPVAIVAASLVSLALAVGAASLFDYFRRLRGPGFALLAVLFHQIYYLYSLGAYAWCVLERAVGARVTPSGQGRT